MIDYIILQQIIKHCLQPLKLYIFLCHLRNRCATRSGFIKKSDKAISLSTKIPRKYIRDARIYLSEKGLIYFKSGVGRKETVYYIIEDGGYTKEQFEANVRYA